MTAAGLAGATHARAAQGVSPTEPDQGPTPVVVFPLGIRGELPPARQTELTQALEEGLLRGGFSVASPANPDPTCKTSGCRAQVAAAAGTKYAIVVEVAVERRDYTISLDVIDAQTEQSVAQSKERCDVCGFSEVTDVIDSQAAAIGTRLDALALEPPVLVFHSVPKGAVILLDGQMIGQAPFERIVDPGPHRIQAERDGYVSEGRDVEAVSGVRITVDFSLQPVPRPHRLRRLRITGWSLLGGGVAFAAVGVPLIVIEGRPYERRCAGSNIDSIGNCKFLYATGNVGIGLTVVGGALLATGVGLVVWTHRRQRDGASVALGANPGGFTLRGHF